MVLPPGSEHCPYCGKERPRPQPKSVAAPGRMTEIIDLATEVGDLWPHVSALALERHAADPARAQRFAAVQYKTLTGRNAWERTLVPGVECDPRVEMQIDRNIKTWLRKKREEERKL